MTVTAGGKLPVPAQALRDFIFSGAPPSWHAVQNHPSFSACNWNRVIKRAGPLGVSLDKNAPHIVGPRVVHVHGIPPFLVS